MKKEEIHWADWHRIFIGEAPGIFMLEVFIRTVVMYLILLIVLRLMGKRMGGQLTISELAVMLTLGAIISLPMQAPDKGLLQGLLVLLCALSFQRGLSLIGFKSSKAERILQGKESLLVKDGVIQVKEMQNTKISNQQLYAVLRNQNIYNLGQIERIYLEASGNFSVFKFKEARPGLSVLPAEDKSVHNIQSVRKGLSVCQRCGKLSESEQKTQVRCNNCTNDKSEPAIL